ncbi:dehydrogenase E1 component subunit alpha/beta [Anaerocolumna xylanovorans]|uniref:2-oxoisovalerate dehydrogenase E1 component n=1 Tax=Anaerocolumna xylanovorans DSM 12503 TaxID=1121345 RepID=A0A1M7Y4F9_9FIRM|nr:alpha-ketoacid dehydrogenase subunit alpha/beta [Anaerocolumna xylanovorans]SHO47121.1 2-oxoisovalerate dehydrogenase E1 component [Anaerocolumna xylanovorans DSM 12503]
MKEQFYAKMFKIRKFEETLLELFSQNKLTGTTHTYLGQEATAVALMNNIREEDYIFSNHRCHGHFIAYSDNAEILLAEIMGKKEGVCLGRGGSQHLCYKHFFSNGVQGGIVPNATGIAFSTKIRNEEGITAVFIGDGTLGQGVVYESFNMAVLYSIPILYIIEDNAYAMTTKTEEGVAGSIVARAEAFGIKTNEVESNDVEELNKIFENACEYVRNEKKPFCQVIHTYRLGPHSKGDDFRSKRELEIHQQKDPILILKQRISEEIVNSIEKQVCKEIEEAVRRCDNFETYNGGMSYIEKDINTFCQESILNNKSEKCVVQLNIGLDKAMREDDNIIILGEDIKDPYGGAFKVTKGLSEKYSNRIIGTPISEAGFIGMGVGLAMNKMKPIIEIMFGDFISLGFDQILNHATKYNWMYANQINVPLLIRVPMGGGRSYGATHSQSLEKYYIGIPNLTTIALSPLHNVTLLIQRIFQNITSPILLVENKKMYSEKQYVVQNDKVGNFYVEESKKLYPVISLTLDNEAIADAVIITYGAMTSLALGVAEKLMVEEEMVVNVLVNTSIAPLEVEDLIKFTGDTKHIVTLEEGTKRLGWGAEVVSVLSEKLKNRTFIRVASEDSVIPANGLMEKEVLPTVEKLYEQIRSVYYE